MISRSVLSGEYFAEGEGFEPSIPIAQYNGFRDRPVQPLRHPSNKNFFYVQM